MGSSCLHRLRCQWQRGQERVRRGILIASIALPVGMHKPVERKFGRLRNESLPARSYGVKTRIVSARKAAPGFVACQRICGEIDLIAIPSSCPANGSDRLTGFSREQVTGVYERNVACQRHC